jgi:hypothetical protein
MNYKHEGHLFYVNADFENAEIVLEGENELGYDLVLDATELKDQAIHEASFCIDDYDTSEAKGYFEDEGELESFLDVNIDLAERIPH